MVEAMADTSGSQDRSMDEKSGHHWPVSLACSCCRVFTFVALSAAHGKSFLQVNISISVSLYV